MPLFVPSLRHNSTVRAVPLRLVPKHAEPTGSLDKLQAAIGVLEAHRRSHRDATRRMVRVALQEVGQVVALAALHMRADTPRGRRFQRDSIDPVLRAIDNATGHCPRCTVRVASWAVPAGRSGFYPCASHKAGAS